MGCRLRPSPPGHRPLRSRSGSRRCVRCYKAEDREQAWRARCRIGRSELATLERNVEGSNCHDWTSVRVRQLLDTPSHIAGHGIDEVQLELDADGGSGVVGEGDLHGEPVPRVPTCSLSPALGPPGRIAGRVDAGAESAAVSARVVTGSNVLVAGCPAINRGRTLAPTPGAAACGAVTTWGQNEPGWLADSSRETKETRRDSPDARASQEARTVVLPNPAGAETRVRAASAPASMSAVSRGRGTTAPRSRGAVSLVVTRVLAMLAPLARLRPLRGL